MLLTNSNRIYIFIIITIIILTAISTGIYLYVSNKQHPKPSPVPTPTPTPTPKPVITNTPLGKYFSKLFPTGNWSDDKIQLMEQLYLSLDSWYTNMISDYQSQIIKTLPNWHTNRMALWNDPPEGIIWQKLFDGSVCDCMRFAYPACNKPSSRFGGKDILIDCPLWPGLNVGKTYNTLLKQAFNTNNNSNNFVKDYFTLPGKGKGFPNGSWIEGLAYPGEYGHPDICGKIPDYLKASQPGLQYKDANGQMQPLNYPYTEGPWFSTSCSDTKPCPVSFLKCTDVTSNGSYPHGSSKTTGNYCLDGNAIAEHFSTENEDAVNSLYNISPRSYSMYVKDNFNTDNFESVNSYIQVGRNSLPSDITTPNTMGYHGLWLYPLRGLGMWRAIGNSFVCNTKLGYLIAPKPNGLGYNIEDMLTLAGIHSGSNQNINKQVNRLIQIIQTGSVNATKSGRTVLYPSMTLATLNKHVYWKKPIVKTANAVDARKLALDLISHWYIDGYCGLFKTDGTLQQDSDYTNGFNYNYQKWFPIGTHFGYASAFDNLVLSNMASNKIDTLQLVLEPQDASAGLRPAYFFEIFQATPSNNIQGPHFSVYTDTNSNQCKSFFMIDPVIDIDNYKEYGYINGSDKVDKNKKVFNPMEMTLTASKISFNP